MAASPSQFGIALLVSTMAVSAVGQTPPVSSGEVKNSSGVVSAAAMASDSAAIPVPAITPAVQLLRDFKTSDVKFDLRDLMEVLRDRRHEGWVLAAYPDPKTGQPLIGAGFSLDLPAREHPQSDPLNSHIFLEPSSAELWQAAGLAPERLQQILERFNDRLSSWNFKMFRGQIRDLPPDIGDEDATLLLRIGAVQAIFNARAYCRNFDQLSGPQQIAMSQLVYQMGVNLQEFSQFLSLINDDSLPVPVSQKISARGAEYWKTVQQSLIQSQWARLYRSRAISVIAMLDPRYPANPRMAERRVEAVLRPPTVHRRRGRSSGSTELASNRKAGGAHGARKSRRARSKRKA